MLSEMGMVVISSTIAVGPIAQTLDTGGKPIGAAGDALNRAFPRFGGRPGVVDRSRPCAAWAEGAAALTRRRAATMAGALVIVRQPADIIDVVIRRIAVAGLRPPVAAPRRRAADEHRGWGRWSRSSSWTDSDRGRVERASTTRGWSRSTGSNFGLTAREPRRLYRGFLRPPGIAAARRCRDELGGELGSGCDRGGRAGEHRPRRSCTSSLGAAGTPGRA